MAFTMQICVVNCSYIVAAQQFPNSENKNKTSQQTCVVRLSA